MNKNRIVKCISALVLVSMLFAVSGINAFALSDTAFSNNNETNETLLSTTNNTPDDKSGLETFKTVSYEKYLENHKGAAQPETEITIRGVDFKTIYDEMKTEIINDLGGEKGEFIKTSEEGGIEWEIDVPETGLYNISIKYYPVAGKSSSIERELFIDGRLPFEGARSFIFPRIWQNKGEIFVDSRGNEFRPSQSEIPMWREMYISGTLGYTMSNYKVYFTEGKHTIRLNSVKEPMAIDYIKLKQEAEIPTYQQYMKSKTDKGYKATSGKEIKIQGEEAIYKSDSTLYPRNDRSSPATEPYSTTKLKINTIGGINWRFPRMWITWEFDAPESGFYNLAIRCKQDFNVDTASTRKIMIDGVVPFKEFENIVVRYSRNWQMIVPGSENPYLVYLEKGKHTITFENNLGPVAELLRTVENSVLTLNEAYRKIIMITGSFPDPLRDYRIHERIPECMEIFRTQSEILDDVMNKLIEIAGNKGNDAAKFEKIVFQMKTFLADPEKIPEQLDNFRINTSSISSWILTASEQPLLMDYMIIKSEDVKAPAADAGTLSKMKHEILAFLSSFVEDYSIIGDVNEDTADDEKGVVTLWLGGAEAGRDQAMVMKTLIDNDFTTKTGIRVNLRLVDMSILLRAVASGKGPDLALFEGQGMPMNYAMRNAIYDLAKFPDIEEVLARFMPSAVEPFRYGDSVWGLPEKQSFHMLFYRKDILEDLDLQVPNTWEELYDILPTLQKFYLQFSMPSAMEGSIESYLYFLFQNGGNIYNEDKSRCIIDQPIGVKSFLQWVELYTRYKLPTVVNELDRFRRGETPIILADYNLYNRLQLLAPEIRGLWDFTLMIGTEMPDGTINRAEPSGASGCCMFKNAKDPEATWEFMKWWTSTETQASYGLEIESLQGASARWATANIEAVWLLPWPTKAAKLIQEQRQYVMPKPEVPGGYMLARNIENAFRITYNLGGNPRDTFLDWIRYINKEIEFKRKEFKLE